MRKLLKLMVLTFFVIAAFTAAYADSVNATVYVFTGALPGDGLADAAHFPAAYGISPNYVFNYTGPIDFSTTSSSNTFGDFMGSYAAGISGLSPSDLSAFLGTTMSTPGTQVESYMAFFFQLNVPAAGFSGVVNHDDGASLYNCNTSLLCNNGYTPIFESPAWTSETGNAFTLPGGVNDYALVYVEANGAPSVLQMPVPAVPEPASLFLLGSGLLGLAGIGRRYIR